MHTFVGIIQRRWFLFVVPLILVLVLSACGSNTPTGTAPGGTSTPSQATTNGCPDTTVVTTPPATANVVLTNARSGSTISAKKGDIIEIDLPFGHLWQGPTNIPQDVLTVQGPTGYAWPTTKTCVWRFLAIAPGTAHLSFTGRPICKKGEACPMYVIAIPFTITVQ